MTLVVVVLVVALVVVGALLGGTHASTPPLQAAFLNQFYASQGFPPWSGWGVGDPCDGGWLGVTCNGLDITYVCDTHAGTLQVIRMVHTMSLVSAPPSPPPLPHTHTWPSPENAFHKVPRPWSHLPAHPAISCV